MNEWIKSAIMEKAYKSAFDSSQEVIKINESIISDLKVLNSSADSLVKSQNKTIKKKQNSIILWKVISGLLVGMFIWTTVKN